jgi:hypothetical protein
MQDTGKRGVLDASYNLGRAIGYGALAGAAAAWAISGILLLIEIVMGFRQGLFYAVIGFALFGPSSTNFVGAQYMGLLLHILTGTLVGAAGGFTMTIWPLFKAINLKKYLVKGIVIGLSAWVLIFLPITSGVVIPSLNRILVPLAENSPSYTFASQITGIIWLVVAGSLVFHVFYGLVYGTMMSILIPYKSKLYICKTCSAKFASSGSMDKHINDNHKWFVCNTCNTEFLGEIGYLKHKEGCR